MSLEFVVNNQQLRRVDTTNVVSNNKNVYTCKFTFIDSEWDELHKFAIFTDGWGKITKVHLGKDSDILTCLVPDEVLEGANFKVAVYGGDLISTNNVTVSIIESGYKNHMHHPHNGHHHSCPSKKDVFVEIFDSLDTKFDSIAYNNNYLHVFNGSKLLESVYLPSLTEEDVNLLIQVFATDFQNLLDDKADKNHTHSLATSTDDGFMSKEDKMKLDGFDPDSLIVDDELDMDSNYPVANHAIATALAGKKDDFDFATELDKVIQNLIDE
ncbi:MAG: hypothetical protein IJH63_00440 [Methanobrevibacter sp.]|nr:hypothetical protein [Methanosphaera sp.]MBR0369171.1 hypothetical protein [Methanobrevibacter sp.]